MTVKPMRRIYHITSIANLPAILAHGGLWCDAERQRLGIRYASIAYEHIKDRRASAPVRRRAEPDRPVAAGGMLCDYVPFYFAPRSPMLLTIHGGNVTNAPPQSDIVHLVSSVEAVIGRGLVYAFTDGHAAVAFSEFYDDPDDLGHVDWPLMKQQYWNDTANDPDRMRRRQAEFLVHSRLPWDLVLGIGVCTPQAAERVQSILTQTDTRPRVKICRNWYY